MLIDKIMYCISINHKNSDLEIRKQFAFSEDTQKSLLNCLINSDFINECLIVCTCNRMELYFVGNENAINFAKNTLAEYSGFEVSRLSKQIFLFYEDRAISHLYNVASGIDSMVIGEDEILGQVKRAYAFAQKYKTTGYELNTVFQAAIACAKRIKTETVLSKTSVSMATLAANEVARLGENVSVMVIGATGKIGTSLVKNLVSHKNISIITTLRNHNNDFTYINDVSTVEYNNRYEYINKVDCLISATSSPHYTITYYDLQKCLKENKNRLFIDLAVPPDIDREIEKISGIRLVDVDYFKTLAKENNSLKLSSVDEAKKIIEEEIEVLKKDILFHSFLPYIDAVKLKLKEKSFEELLYKLREELSAEEFEKILNVYKTFGGVE
ncbi:MAG: glutamyl-tRNA reductase [Candidatus Pseudoruminococcus sp.]|nr:glutamyl-tRNA reductase [Ruminococcus sp.]MDY2783713.1 glutamyl-tRNA reductase [Candidatus Pseudoruminococcus sp.]